METVKIIYANGNSEPYLSSEFPDYYIPYASYVIPKETWEKYLEAAKNVSHCPGDPEKDQEKIGEAWRFLYSLAKNEAFNCDPIVQSAVDVCAEE